jgi:signal transduction histidine kinase
MRHFDGTEHAPDLAAAVALHTHVQPAEDYTDLVDGDERSRSIVVLQQQARSLQAEIAHRRRAEERLQAALEAESAAHEEMQTLYRLGRLVGAELDLERLVQAVTDAGTELTGAELGAFIYTVLDDRVRSYTLSTSAGAQRGVFQHVPSPRATAAFGPTFRGEGIVRLDDVRADPRYGHHAPPHGMPPGQPPVVSYLAVPVVSRSGEVLGGLFFGHGRAGVFTERHEKLVAGLAGQTAAAMDNARLYREAQDSLRLREQFLGAIAHDLKTPLAAIKGGAQMLKRQVARGALTAERLTAAADGLDHSATRLGRLVEQLLDVARVQAGRPFDLDLQPTDLVALARRLAAEHQRGTDVHHVRVEAAAPELVGEWDGARIERALDNLLSNAVKYSPEGGEVLVQVEQVDAVTAAFSVQDHGVGIPSADLPRIFEQFHRAANVEGRISGTGIGLASAHQVVSLHGGVIEVASQEGQGATFTVRIPLAGPRAPRA